MDKLVDENIRKMKSDKRTQFTEEAFDTLLNRERSTPSAGFTESVLQATALKGAKKGAAEIYTLYQKKLSWVAAAAALLLVMNLSVLGFITFDYNNLTSEEQNPEISTALYNYYDSEIETSIDWTDLTDD